VLGVFGLVVTLTQNTLAGKIILQAL
jgi:hypothetical protein